LHDNDFFLKFFPC